MKGATYKVIFNRKKKKLGKDEKALIQIEVYHKRVRKYFSTGIYVTSEQFKEGSIIKHPNARELNYSLKDKITELENFEYSKTNGGQEFNLDSLKIFEENGGSGYTFLKFVADEIKANTSHSPNTKKNHDVLLNLITRCNLLTKFSDVTYKNIEAFDNWLRDTRGETTIYGYHKRLKIYVKKAILKDYIKNNPYDKFTPKAGRYADRKFLDAVQLKKIEDKKGLLPRIDIVRDIFLFQCYTGLAYSDIEKLTYKLISTDETGNQWIKLNRVKTDESCVILLLPKAIELLQKYAGSEKCFPVNTNQKYNSYLKEVAEICDINKELTTHMARHTFATTVTLMNGVSLETVSRMLGHSSVKTTQIYAKITENRIKDEMTALREKLQK